MRQTRTLVFFIFLMALSFSLRATHIVGGEMTYSCLGNNQYEIKLTIFRDCFNGIPWFDDPASIGVFSNSTNLFLQQILVPLDPMLNDTIDPTLDDECLAIPPNVCVNTTTYTTVVTLPFLPGGYHLAYQRCCRNNTILNLIAPEDVGATYDVVVTEQAMMECNSSPVFNEWPPLYLCANVPFEIDQSAVDPDGDSLVYKLCNPLTGASDIAPMPQPPNPPPYDTVPWLPPYGVNSMINIPPAPPMVIDPATGLLTGTPTVLGQFVIGICVEEYRNGELIGISRRDYQVNVGDCQAIVASIADLDTICGSRTVTFQNESINATDFKWFFNDPGNPGAMSTDPNPTYTFSDWGTYTVMLIAAPGAACSDTAYVEVTVAPNSARADFDVELIACLDNVIIRPIDQSVDTFSTIVSWEWTLTIGSNVFTSSDQFPQFEVTPPGGAVLILTVTNALGCTDTFEDIFPVKPSILVLDLGPDITGCQVGQLELDAGPGFDTYLWNDMSTGQTLIVTAPGTYSVTVTDLCGGTDADALTVSIVGMDIDAGPDVEICEGVSHVFNVPGFDTYEWTPSGSLSCSDCPNPIATPATTTTYTVTATTADGCVSTDSATVVVLPNVATSQDISICEGETVDVFGNPVSMTGTFSMTFIAHNGCDSIHTINVSVLPTVETTATIAICEGETVDVFGNPVSTAGTFSNTFTGQNGCDSTHTITVEVHPVFEAIADVQICEGDTVLVFGVPVSTSGHFSDTLQTVHGCDSILIVNLAVLPNSFTNENISICFGETTDIFGTQVGTAGVYEMTFTAENGCDSTHTITLEVYDEITIQVQTTDATCFGLSDGTATAIASGGNGGFTYLWSNGDVGEIATALPAGTHSVTVTDATGCTAMATVTVGQPPALEVTATGVDVSCTQPGSISASATGGTGNIGFAWNTGDATPTVTGLFAGTYTVTATDENNCTATASVTITGALAPEINITVDQQLTEDAPESGQLSIAITGGTPPFDILWNNGSTADSLFNLTSGQYIATVTDASGCEVMDTAYLFVPACTGGKIWKDTNRDGCQDGGETGMAGVEMYLAGTDIWGNTVADTTTSALNGEYIFEPLAPGEYLLSMNVPDGFTLSPPDACTDDFVDSDFDANGVATEVVVLVEGHCCLIIDGGLYDGCLNVYDPGTICCDQVLCGPGNVPAPITSGSPAAGAAQVEYRWIFSENNSVNAGGSGWKPVLDAFGNPVNATTLYPGALYVTTYFARCVRATTCTEWLVTDVVTIIVDDEASALIDEPGAICVGDEIQFSAAPNGPGASYLWNFGPTANPSFSNDPAPTVVYQQSGYPTVWLTVTNNGCTSTDRMLIAVSNDPVYCGTAIGTPGIFQNGQAPQQATFRIYPNPVSDQLTISWNADIGPVVMVEIRSLEGKLLQVLKTDAVQSRLQTDLHYLRPGLYMLRLQYGDGRQEVFKLVKK